MKFPVYVKIETDNKDRSKVSKVAKEILYPVLLQFLAKASYKEHYLRQVSIALDSPVSVSLLTELDLLHNQVSKESPSTNDVSE